jgi:hypothetical protein
MKVAVTFNGQGLSLELFTETEAEQRMIGAVLGQPQVDRQSEIVGELVMASLGYEGHFSNKRVNWLKLNVLKDQR